MLAALKLVHFIGVILGFVGGIGNAMADKRLSSVPPEAMPIVGAFREALAKLSSIGLLLLWLSGIAIIWGWHGWAVFESPLFSLKIAAVVVLTGFSLAANLTVLRARRAGTEPDPDRMRRIGMGAMSAGTVALILAVIRFS